MGTGKDVTFENDGQKFEISLSEYGYLDFLANDSRDRVMTLFDDKHASFAGDVYLNDVVATALEVSGNVAAESLQLTDGHAINTIHLGSSSSEATILVGGANYSGQIELYDGQGNVRIRLSGARGTIELLDGNGNVTLRLP